MNPAYRGTEGTSSERWFVAGWHAFAAFLLLTLALGFANRTPHLFEWDSAQYALGVRDFDIARHQPHPPGYPLWIALLKVSRIFVSDTNVTQEAYGNLFIAGGLFHFFEHLQKLVPARRALLGTLLLGTVAMVVLYGRVASTYPIDLLMSCYFGRASFDVWSRERRPGPLLGAIWGVFAGMRQSGAILMLPLLGVACVRARARPADVARAAGAAAIVCAAWFFPAALLHGGVARYISLTRQATQNYVGISVFFGGSAATHLQMIWNSCRYVVISMSGAATSLGLALIAWAVARSWRASDASKRGERLPLGYLFAWIAPNLAYVFGVHSVKPGYLMLSLPPAILAIVVLVERVSGNVRAVAGEAALGAGILVNLASPAYFEELGNRTPVSHNNAWIRGVPRMAAISGASIDRYATVVGALGGDPRRFVTIVLSNEYEGANWRVLMTEFPSHAIVHPGPWGLELTQHYEQSMLTGIPRSTEFLLWLAPPSWTPARTYGLPGARRIYADNYHSIWLTKIDAARLRCEFFWEGRRYSVVGSVTPGS